MGPGDSEHPLTSNFPLSSPLRILPPSGRWHGSRGSPNPSFSSLSSPDLPTLPSSSNRPASPLPPEPGLVLDQPVRPPPAHDSPNPEMSLLTGGELAPMPSSPPPRQPSSRPGPGLRLPSFEALGIAAPHPDRFGLGIFPTEKPLGAMKSSVWPRYAEVESHLVDFTGPTNLTHAVEANIPPSFRRVVQSPIQHDLATLTPPAETGDVAWNPTSKLTLSSMQSPTTDSSDQPAAAQHEASHFNNAPPTNSPTQPPEMMQSDLTSNLRPWLQSAAGMLLENLRSATESNNSLRVLSHALPSPSPKGHVFGEIINAIHQTTPTSPTVWINVFHAIPGRFNLADLSCSPPNTPGSPISGDDYFTQKVFDSAVPISDYQEDLSALPRSPRPVVPPSSINVSIVERYIPPTSLNEFRDMFELNGPSILVDRLVELSPNNGSLIFIYPNRAGAQRFMRDYLGPILDPILRSIAVLNGLSSDMSRTLGTMMAADQMPDHDQLSRSMYHLCAKLTQRSSNMQRFHGNQATYSVVHTSMQHVPMNRDVWAKDWWTKQEKGKIREAMTRYAQDAQRKSSNEHVERAATPTELIEQLMGGVLKKPYPEGQEPSVGIEISVFVIKRST